MASINKVIIVGNLGRDPETRYTTGGDPICNLAIATSDRWKDKATGEQRESTEWHRVSAFGRLAEIMGQYLKKGSQVYIEGRLRTRKYTDKDGVDRWQTEIIADQMQMLGVRGEQSQSGGSRDYERAKNGEAPRKSDATGLAGIDDDIPFQKAYPGIFAAMA